MSETTASGEPGLVLRWGRKGRDDSGVRSMAVVPGGTPALRLNTDLGVRYRPERLAEVPDNLAKVARLQDEIMLSLDIFAKHPRQFLEAYFRFIAERIEAEKAVLDQGLAWSDGLFGAGDWIFSALRPLPMAVVEQPDGQADSATAVCDFAFWTGRQVIAIELRGSAQNLRKTAERDWISSDLVRPITVPVTALADGTNFFAAGEFPPEFLSFWEGEKVPSSPFRPIGLTQRPVRDPL